MYDARRITRVTTGIAGIVSVVVALLFPIGYYYVSYESIQTGVEVEAEITGRIVTDVINSNPDLWNVQQTRLEELLSRRTRENPQDIRRIFDKNHALVAESVIPLKAPLLRRNFDLLDSGATVGTLEIVTSLFPLLLRSGVALLLGLCCGAVIFITLRVLPMKAVAKAEKKLTESEARYRGLVDKAPNAILVYGKERVLYANQAAVQLLGAENFGQVVGQEITTFFRSDEGNLFQEFFKAPEIKEERDVQRELNLTRVDGAHLDIVAVGIRSDYLDNPAVQVILHDVTERKRLQEELSGKVVQLEAALIKVRLLEGIIPICMYCKKIRDDKQGWSQIERYITEHSDAQFSHGICPECFEKTMEEMKDMETRKSG
ncbi:MAG: PAS domain S-box protein [Desulfuromonadaceae bacterium]|nr:PAS domain S-box protein [Desulfuromonadaceae bacterium]MDD5105139.1 PAS domain S-box protein [Desulfuromonadaceae bacterium]